MRKQSLSQKQYFDRKRKKKSAPESPVLHDESVHKTTPKENPVLHDESFHGLSVDDVLSGEMDVQMMDFISQVLKTQFKSHFEVLMGYCHRHISTVWKSLAENILKFQIKTLQCRYI